MRKETFNLETKVLQTIKKFNLIENNDKIVLGVSGGPDSICMLEILKNIITTKKEFNNVKIIVVHINHMIRKEAIEDENYVKNYCNKNNIEFYSKSIDVQKLANNNKIGTEEAGRNARYNFFNEILEKTNSNKIAIAHNKNDKIETIIMHILRGSGIKGLIGIEAKRNQYIRPLIECERKEIEKYCEQKKLNPCIDKTNFENIYTRNKIRNVVIPYVQKEFNPNIIKTIDRLSYLVSEEEEYMEKQTKDAYYQILIEYNKNSVILDLKKFNMLEKAIKARVVRYAIYTILGNNNQIELIHIEDIIKLCENNIGNKYLTPNKNIKVLIKNKKIYYMLEKKQSST